MPSGWACTTLFFGPRGEARSSFVFRLADRPLFWALLLGAISA